jgi:hypothetical protein
MIVLNSEKEIIKISNWDDIKTRPGFNENLNPSNHELKSIIGRYGFKDQVSCGLSTCHSPHNRGYLVVTKDGQETNIGKDCGKNYFGVDFETMSAQLDRDLTEKENRDRLWSFSFSLDGLKQKISALRHQQNGVDWVYKYSRRLIDKNDEVPSAITKQIHQMVKTRKSVLSIEQELNPKEIQELELAEGRTISYRPVYIAKPIASIDGLEVLYPENNLKQIVVNELEEKVKQFEQLDIDKITFNDLRTWTKWIGTVDNLFEQADRALLYGTKLLKEKNLGCLQHLLKQSEEKRVFSKFTKSLPP